MLFQFIKATLLSILIFFSISFLTILFDIHSPLRILDAHYELTIGFPFEYYNQFWMRSPTSPNGHFLHGGWNGVNLILDCFIAWSLTIVIWFSIFYINKKRNNL